MFTATKGMEAIDVRGQSNRPVSSQLNVSHCFLFGSQVDNESHCSHGAASSLLGFISNMKCVYVRTEHLIFSSQYSQINL